MTWSAHERLAGYAYCMLVPPTSLSTVTTGYSASIFGEGGGISLKFHNFMTKAAISQDCMVSFKSVQLSHSYHLTKWANWVSADS